MEKNPEEVGRVTAAEARRIAGKVAAARDMIPVYQVIREAATLGRLHADFYLRQLSALKAEILKELGYKVEERWQENGSQDRDTMIGYRVIWGE